MPTQELNKEMEALRADIVKLRADVAGVVDALKEAGMGQIDDAKAKLSGFADTVREEIRRGVEGARDSGKKSAAAVGHQIEERPLLSLLTVFGVGVLLGKLLDTRGSR